MCCTDTSSESPTIGSTTGWRPSSVIYLEEVSYLAQCHALFPGWGQPTPNSPGISSPSLLSSGEGNGAPLQYSCLANPMDGGAWKAAVHGVTEGWTWLSDFIFTFHFHALEKEMATHSSVLAWRIPGTGEPGGLLSMGSHRVGHDWGDLVVVVVAFFLQLETALWAF